MTSIKHWRIALALILGLVLVACSHKSAREHLRTPLHQIAIANRLAVKTLWSKPSGIIVDKQHALLLPTIQGDVAYLGDHHGTVRALSLTTSKTLWSKRITTGVSGRIGTDTRLLYVPGRDGRVHAVEPKTGKKLWNTNVLGLVNAPPAQSSGMVVIRTLDGNVFGVSAQNGGTVWSYEHKQPSLVAQGQSRPVFFGDQVIIGMDEGDLVSLNLFTGKKSWAEPVAFQQAPSQLAGVLDIDADPILENGHVYALSYHGSLNDMRADTGEILWYQDYSSTQTPASYYDRLLATSEAGYVTAISKKDGRKLFEKVFLRYYDLTAPVLYGTVFAVGVKGTNTVFWFDTATGNVVAKTPLPGKKQQIVSLSQTAYGVLVLTRQGMLTLLRPGR
jgi:outer membrane protein assembly factor BamB